MFGINYKNDTSNSDKKLNESRIAKLTLNDKTSSLKVEDSDNKTDYVSQFCWSTDNMGYRNGFDVVLASTKESDKNKYRADAAMNYVPSIQHGTFREGMRNLLSIDELFARWEEPYEFVIFDMPPHSDNYSDVIFDCLLDKKHMPKLKCEDVSKQYELKYSNNLFLVMTEDISQHEVTLEYLEAILKSVNNEFDKIFIVSNSIRQWDPPLRDDVEQNKLWHILPHIVKESDKYENIRQLTEKITFMEMSVDLDYARLCCTQDGIINRLGAGNTGTAEMQDADKTNIDTMASLWTQCVLADWNGNVLNSSKDKKDEKIDGNEINSLFKILGQ